jgi:hypothetical protein
MPDPAHKLKGLSQEKITVIDIVCAADLYDAVHQSYHLVVPARHYLLIAAVAAPVIHPTNPKYYHNIGSCQRGLPMMFDKDVKIQLMMLIAN